MTVIEKPATNKIRLSVVSSREAATGRWIVQAVERDIAASGDTLDEAFKNFDYLVTGFLVLSLEHNHEIFRGIKPAPKRFSDQFSTAKAAGAVVTTTRQLLPVFKARTARTPDIKHVPLEVLFGTSQRLAA